MTNETNNSKNQNIKTRSSCSGIIGLLAIITAFTGYYVTENKTKRELSKAQTAYKKNETARKAYAKTYDFNKMEQICHRIDSLNERNQDLIDNAFENYFEKLDRKYTLGKFLDATQIKKINDVISLNLHESYNPNDIVYKYVKSYMPINAMTPLRTFEDIVDYLCITPIELMPYGVEFDGGEIFRFYKTTSQNLFYKYLDEYQEAYATDTEPNFGVKEIAPAHDEYARNCDKIAELERQVAQTDSVFDANLARFDATRDSLNKVIQGLKAKQN